MSQPYVGQIILFAGNFAIANYAMCDGSLLSIANNDVLFNLIGTTYGGDGQTTFALPDLRGRVPVHQGNNGSSTYVIGQTGGVETVTLTASQTPAHTHSLTCSSATGALNTAAGNYFAGSAAQIYGTPSSNYVSMGSQVSLAGGSQPHSNQQPYVAMTYLISLYGIYPSQN
jgi:microcystin-dependent protein